MGKINVIKHCHILRAEKKKDELNKISHYFDNYISNFIVKLNEKKKAKSLC